MIKVIILTDYKGFFGSKHDEYPYRSGFDLKKLKECFVDYGFDAEYIQFNEADLSERKWDGVYVLYTSSEEEGYIYKHYIEDVVLALSVKGACIIPSYNYLRANNDKTFMELFRDTFSLDLRGNIKAYSFGCIEELLKKKEQISFPAVIKGSAGAMGKSVFLANNFNELVRIAKNKITYKSSLRHRLKERVREIIHKGYTRESFYRGEFIIQEYIPGLNNDWKVYFFGEKTFVFFRPVMPGRKFRASGGGYDNYSYGSNANIPAGLFDFGWRIFSEMNVPNASFDIGWDGEKFYLFEFQCIFFGTAGILKRYSSVYFHKTENGWETCENEGNIEKVYAESVAMFIKKIK